jgi:hypothetical protein
VTPRAALEIGEMENGYGIWKDDFYGQGAILKAKKVFRGYDEERHKEIITGLGFGKEIIDLMEWKGGESGFEIFKEDLPWDSINGDDDDEEGEEGGVTIYSEDVIVPKDWVVEMDGDETNVVRAESAPL